MLPLNSLLDTKHAVFSYMPKTACFYHLIVRCSFNPFKTFMLSPSAMFNKSTLLHTNSRTLFLLIITFNHQPTKYKFIFLRKPAYRLEPFRGFYTMHVTFYLILHNLFCYFIAIIDITFS